MGEKRFLVLLIEFSDLSFTLENPQEAFSNQLNQEGYSAHGATGSVRDFYIDNSSGQFMPIYDVYGPVKVSKAYSYYGKNDAQGSDTNPDEALYEACCILDPDLDFSIYDNDHDGFVDFVYVIYAGRGEADGGGGNTIWPHTSWIYSSYGKTVYLDGKRLDTYACSPELQSGSGYLTRDGIGSFCHEFSHVLGLSDHYATNYSSVKQTGAWDLMCSGSYNNNSNTPAVTAASAGFIRKAHTVCHTFFKIFKKSVFFFLLKNSTPKFISIYFSNIFPCCII